MSLADVRWIELPHAVDERGVLTAIEAGRDIPFEITRVFYMRGTPAGVERVRSVDRSLYHGIAMPEKARLRKVARRYISP